MSRPSSRDTLTPRESDAVNVMTVCVDSMGDYYRYPCPIDAACLDLLGIDADAFRAIACQVVGDEAGIHELNRAGANLQQLTGFDPVRLNAELHAPDCQALARACVEASGGHRRTRRSAIERASEALSFAIPEAALSSSHSYDPERQGREPLI